MNKFFLVINGISAIANIAFFISTGSVFNLLVACFCGFVFGVLLAEEIF